MMDAHIAALFPLADEIALLQRSIADVAGGELEQELRYSLVRMQRLLDGLLDETEGVIDTMPWWLEWRRASSS
jgi:hypothetical protein